MYNNNSSIFPIRETFPVFGDIACLSFISDPETFIQK